MRKVDNVYRYGGDEFVVLLPNTTREQAQEARQRIINRLTYQNSLNPEVPYMASIGLHSMEGGDSLEALEHLDSDLYRQKDKKFSRNLDDVAEHIEDMLKDERSKLGTEGKYRKG